MGEPKRDFINVTNPLAWLAAIAVFILVAMQMPHFSMYWLPALVAGIVLVVVTFGLDKLLRSAGGFGGLALATMSTVSFVVAILQLIIWLRDWPFKP